MIYDWRSAARHRCQHGAVIYDAEAGEKIDRVFYVDTDIGQVGRWDGHKRVWEQRKVRIQWEAKQIA